MSKATVSTKGHLIDSHCQYNTGLLVEKNKAVYDCTLNQTDIGSNKNKFYIMQVINTGSKYCVYIRYGRIGEKGTISYKDFTSEQQAISFFEKQFRSKTGNSWYDRDNFVKKDRKYFLAEIECADVSEEESESKSSESESSIDIDSRVTDFLKLICNINYMKNTLVQLEIDTEKMPLGKISQTQIDKAYDILNQINQNLGKHKDLVKLSSEFYTLIPIACGRQSPPIINSTKLVGKNLDLLNELSHMVFGSKAVTKLKKEKGNIQKIYDDLHTEITPLDETDEMYQILEEYLRNSKAPTHNFKYEILDIFEINRESEREIYDQFTKKINNKTLLFHGTRVSNLVSILQNGLMCDPSRMGINVSIAGKMFGLGLYFANSASKSIQYCAYDTSDNIACLFIAEVALGKQLEKKSATPSLTDKTMPKGYHSTWGLGKSGFSEYDEYDDDTQIPKGKLKQISGASDRCLLYDEFIVYHDEQVNLRYIIKLKVI